MEISLDRIISGECAVWIRTVTQANIMWQKCKELGANRLVLSFNAFRTPYHYNAQYGYMCCEFTSKPILEFEELFAATILDD